MSSCLVIVPKFPRVSNFLMFCDVFVSYFVSFSVARACRICTVLDKTSMFGVTSTKKDGEQKRHHVSRAAPTVQYITGCDLPYIKVYEVYLQ